MALAYTFLVHLLETRLMCSAMRWVFVTTKINYHGSQLQQKYRLITNLHVYKKMYLAIMHLFNCSAHSLEKYVWCPSSDITERNIGNGVHEIGVCYFVKYWGGCLIRGRKLRRYKNSLIKTLCDTTNSVDESSLSPISVHQKGGEKKVAMKLVESSLLQEWRFMIAWKKLKSFTLKAA